MSVKTQSHNPYRGKRKALLQAMLDPENVNLSVVDLCKKAGVSQRIYYTYTQEEKFNEALKDQVIRLYARHLPQSANRLAKLAKQGDMKALKLIHESLDMAGNRYNQTVNIANQTERHEVVAETHEQLIEELDKQIDDLTRLKIQLTGGNPDRLTPCHTPPDEDEPEA